MQKQANRNDTDFGHLARKLENAAEHVRKEATAGSKVAKRLEEFARSIRDDQNHSRS